MRVLRETHAIKVEPRFMPSLKRFKGGFFIACGGHTPAPKAPHPAHDRTLSPEERGIAEQ